MKKKLLLLLVCFVLFSKLGMAQAIFPQFADGVLSDGSSYRSTLVIQSTDPTVTQTCMFEVYNMSSLQYTTSTGQVVAGTPGQTAFNESTSTLSFTLKSLSFQLFQSAGTASINTGYASLMCSGTNWNAFLLYTLYGATGVKLSEATVFPSAIETAGNISASQLVVDQRGGARMAIALTNISGTVVANYNVTIVDATGALIGEVGIGLGPNNALPQFLDELISFADLTLPANFVGQVTIAPVSASSAVFGGPQQPPAPIYAIGLRFTGALFTTVPVSKCFSSQCTN